MIKVLMWSDFLCSTGFGNVAEEIVQRLHATGKYKFTVIANNYFGEPYNVPTSPYYKFRDIPIYGCASGPYNSPAFKKMVEKGGFDVLFIQLDAFNIALLKDHIFRAKERDGFRYILYSPIDNDDMHLAWIVDGFEVADYSFVYTKHGVDAVHKYKPSAALGAIYIGTDTDVYYPLSKEERGRARKELLDAGPDDFVMLNIGTNQKRKDLPRTIFTWLEVQKRIPSARLLIHTMHKREANAGYDLNGVIEMHVPAHLKESVLFPSAEIPKARMREVIGAADVLVSTSMGEGWGMPVTEAMACGVPVVVPRHSSFTEIVGENEERGLLADTEGFIIIPNDMERRRPVASLQSMVEKVLQVYRDPKGTRRRADAALAWVKESCNWDKICTKWDMVLTVAGTQAQHERRIRREMQEEENDDRSRADSEGAAAADRRGEVDGRA